MNPFSSLVMAVSVVALLTFVVGVRMYLLRVREMKAHRIHPQSVALSAERAARLKDTRAADNYNHLFELPVLFYALAAVALATGHVPSWLALGAWAFAASRIVHSVIQCTYNKVMHRFAVFIVGFLLLFLMWIGFVLTYLAR
ncbi:MAPEG family protein [Halomonas denitrificans]|nr:MAPEG family protein [Halomonas denitrificans]